MTLKDIAERLERIEREYHPSTDDMRAAVAELKRDIEMHILKTTGTL